MSATLSRLVEQLGRRQDLDRLADPAQKAVSATFASGGRLGRRVQDILNGTWLGHPLHPVLTDLPIGFWTASLAIDAVDAVRGGDNFSAAADLSLGLGVGSAVLTAASGLADWQFTTDTPRRIGLAHAVLNSAALLLNLLSLLLRGRNARAAGRALSLAGVLFATASAYLGGHLISVNGVGIDHATGVRAPDEFIPIVDESELQEGRPHRAEAAGLPVVLVKQDGRIFALAGTCAHLGGPLFEGEVRDGGVVCPWHGSRFDLEDGHVLDGPSAFPQPVLETRVRDGKIEVRGRSFSAIA